MNHLPLSVFNMQQWYALCLFIFLRISGMARLLRRTFVSWWFLHWIWYPISGMQHYYFTIYPTDDWHLEKSFNRYAFSWLCVWDWLYHYSFATGQDFPPALMHPDTPTHRKHTLKGISDPHLSWARRRSLSECIGCLQCLLGTFCWVCVED